MKKEPELYDVEELTLSLNYFDEIAIEKAWGKDLDAMYEDDKVTLALRALLFVAKRREGMKDKQAFEYAAGLTNGQIPDLFKDPDPDDDDPETESGKDDVSTG